MSSARVLVSAVVGIALFAGSAAEAGTSRGFENGGKFRRFDPVVAEFNQNGAPFRIVGLCQSACTLFLSIRNVCIEPQAVFQFHAGNDGNGNISKGATEHMLRAYNPKLRRFVIENGYLETFKFHTITGRDMIEKFGYPVCTAQHYIEAEQRDTPRGSEGSYFNPRSGNNPVRRGIEGTYSR